MGRLLTLVVAAVLIVVPAADAKAKPKPAWKTTKQVENYLEKTLKRWGGVDLAHADFKIVFCLQGNYSKAETRIGKKYPTHTTSAGEDLYASFACTLGAEGHTFSLYVRTLTGNRFQIIANR